MGSFKVRNHRQCRKAYGQIKGWTWWPREA